MRIRIICVLVVYWNVAHLSSLFFVPVSHHRAAISEVNFDSCTINIAIRLYSVYTWHSGHSQQLDNKESAGAFRLEMDSLTFNLTIS